MLQNSQKGQSTVEISLRTFIRENLGPAKKHWNSTHTVHVWYIKLQLVDFHDKLKVNGWIMKVNKGPTSTSKTVMMTTFPTWSRFERQAPSDDVATTKQTNGYESLSLAPHEPPHIGSLKCFKQLPANYHRNRTSTMLMRFSHKYLDFAMLC